MTIDVHSNYSWLEKYHLRTVFRNLRKNKCYCIPRIAFFVFYASKTVETMRMQPSVPKNIISTIANIHANFLLAYTKNGL